MTLDEVNKIEDINARIRAFSQLPEAEQNKIFTIEELATLEATDALHRRYMEIAAEARTKLMQDADPINALMLMLRTRAADELGCDLARIGRPSFDTTFPGLRGPIEIMKRQIRLETMQS